MPYVVINAQMFTACYSGSLAGMGVSGRMLDDTNASDYTNEVLTANAIAQEFDTLWNSAAAVGNLEIELTHQAFEALFQNRNPPVDSDAFTPSSYEQQCRVIIAIIQRSLALYAAEGYPNPSGGAGSQTWADTLILGNVSPGGGTNPPLIASGDYIEDEVEGDGLLFQTKTGLPNQAPGAIQISPGNAGGSGIYSVGGLFRVSSGISGGFTGGVIHEIQGGSETANGNVSYTFGNSGEGGDRDSGYFTVAFTSKGGAGSQGHFYLSGPGAFYGAQAFNATPDATITVPGFWIASTVLISGGNGLPFFRDQAGVDHQLAYTPNQSVLSITVKARTTQTLPAYTYDNGTAGVGATITINNPATAFPTLDNITIDVGDFFYLANGSNPVHNGLYRFNRAHTGVLGAQATRILGFDSGSTIPGTSFKIQFGTQYSGAEYAYTYNRVIVVGTDPIYYTRQDIGKASPNEACYFYEDFAAGVYPTANGGVGGVWLYPVVPAAGALITAGASGQNNNINRGIFTVSSGTSANARSGLVGAWTLVDAQPDGGGSFTPTLDVHLDFEAYITNITLSTAAQEYARVVGYAKQRIASAGAGAQVKPADGIYFYYDRQTSANWQCVTSLTGSPGSNTTTVTSVPVTAGVFNRLQIIKDAGFNEIRFYIDGVLVATHTNNIPNTQVIGLQDVCYRSNGITNTSWFSADYYKQNLQFPQGRAA